MWISRIKFSLVLFFTFIRLFVRPHCFASYKMNRRFKCVTKSLLDRINRHLPVIERFDFAFWRVLLHHHFLVKKFATHFAWESLSCSHNFVCRTNIHTNKHTHTLVYTYHEMRFENDWYGAMVNAKSVTFICLLAKVSYKSIFAHCTILQARITGAKVHELGSLSANLFLSLASFSV